MRREKDKTMTDIVMNVGFVMMMVTVILIGVVALNNL